MKEVLAISRHTIMFGPKTILEREKLMVWTIITISIAGIRNEYDHEAYESPSHNLYVWRVSVV